MAPVLNACVMEFLGDIERETQVQRVITLPGAGQAGQDVTPVEAILTFQDSTAVVLQESGRVSLWNLPNFVLTDTLLDVGHVDHRTFCHPYCELSAGQRIAYDAFGNMRCVVCFHLRDGLKVHESPPGNWWQECVNRFQMDIRPWHLEVSLEHSLVYFISTDRKGIWRWEYNQNSSDCLCEKNHYVSRLLHCQAKAVWCGQRWWCVPHPPGWHGTSVAL